MNRSIVLIFIIHEMRYLNRQIPPGPPLQKWGAGLAWIEEGSSLLPEAGSLRSNGASNGVLLAGKREVRRDLKSYE